MKNLLNTLSQELQNKLKDFKVSSVMYVDGDIHTVSKYDLHGSYIDAIKKELSPVNGEIKHSFIKVSEAPKTKLQLKKAILNGTISVFENNGNFDDNYRELESVNSIIKLWDGFSYAPKYSNQESTAKAYLGTSFNYKFTSKISK